MGRDNDPVRGVNDARLDDNGGLVRFAAPARDKSKAAGITMLCRLLSVWRRIKPRLFRAVRNNRFGGR